MTLISENLQKSLNSIHEVMKELKNGNKLSNEDAQALMRVIEDSKRLRILAIKEDYRARTNVVKLAKKYCLSRSQIYKISDMPDDAIDPKLSS